jgi:hypothetical protein
MTAIVALYLSACSLLAPVNPGGDPVKQGVVRLLAEEPFYQAAPQKEVVLEGLLEADRGVFRRTRRHPFRLALDEGGRATTLPLYVPGKAHLLTRHAGQRVRIRGKVVDTTVGRTTYHEVWPASLEALTGALPATPGADGVYVRCVWQPEAARRPGASVSVIRSGEQLAAAMRMTGGGAAGTATVRMARLLRIPGIDWSKYMLVSVSAGLRASPPDRVIVTRAAAVDRTLVVRYRLPASSGGGFGCPAETVLVPRFDGPVRIEAEPPPGGAAPR